MKVRKIIQYVPNKLATIIIGFVVLWLYVIAFVPTTRDENWDPGIWLILVPAAYLLGLFAQAVYQRIKR